MIHRIWLLGVVSLAIAIWPNTGSTEEREDAVANTFAKAANYIFYSEFDQNPIDKVFSDDDLDILSEHLGPLNFMIRTALGLRHSVGGAMLMAHFNIEENMYYRRAHMLRPGRTYGWEGLYTSDEGRFYSDEQYVYCSIYLKAIEQLLDAPLHEAIELNFNERQQIIRLANTPGHGNYHWAIWIGRKLEIL